MQHAGMRSGRGADWEPALQIGPVWLVEQTREVGKPKSMVCPSGQTMPPVHVLSFSPSPQ